VRRFESCWGRHADISLSVGDDFTDVPLAEVPSAAGPGTKHVGRSFSIEQPHDSVSPPVTPGGLTGTL
jgi:hypothetical protein